MVENKSTLIIMLSSNDSADKIVSSMLIQKVDEKSFMFSNL